MRIADLKGLFFIAGGTKFSFIWRICFTLWSVFLIALIIKSLAIPGKQSVFGVYVDGVKHWWSDESLYAKYPGIDFFRYAPSAVFLFEPFVLFGPVFGPLIWGILSVFAVFYSCKLMAGTFWPSNSAWGIGGIMALLCALSGLWNHQSNAIIGFLLVFGTINIYQNKSGQSALLFSIACVLKSTVLPVVALLLILKPFSMLWRIILIFLLFAILPFLTKPPETVIWQYLEWGRHLQSTHDIRWPGYRDFWFVILSIAEWIRPGEYDPQFWNCSAPSLYKFVQAGTGLCCLLFAFIWRSLPPVDWYPRTLALGLAWLMVFGPATELPTYGLFAPMLCWAFVRQFTNVQNCRLNGQSFILTVSFAFLLVLAQREFTIFFAPAFPVILSAAPIGSIIFIIWLIRDTRFLLHLKNDR